MKPRDVAVLLIVVTAVGTVKAEPEPIFFIDLWKPIEAIIKLIGKIDFGSFGNIIKIKGDSDDSKKDIDSKKDDDSKKESDDDNEDEDSDDEWDFEPDFEFLDRKLKNVPNPESADPVAQSYMARSGVLPDPNLDDVVSETADVAEVAKEDLEEVVRRSVRNNGRGTNKRNAIYDLNLLPKESKRVRREVKNPGKNQEARKEFPIYFNLIFDVMKNMFADFITSPRKEKRTTQVTNYRTVKRDAEKDPTTELNLLERFLSDWLIDAPIDSKVAKRHAISLQALVERFRVAADRMLKRQKESKVDKRHAEESNEKEPNLLDRFLTTMNRILADRSKE